MGPKLGEIPKAYDPKQVEDKWYRFWLERGYFTPEIDPDKKPFVIIMPPPNITGELHLGHALTATMEDILVRWHRMQGEAALWLPGVDHAGIAAQNTAEQALAAQGLSRHSLGRKRFLEQMWQWTGKYRDIIAQQHRKLGASCDWTRERFTLDPGPSRAVRTTFVKLHQRGLIYRSERLINWCPRCATALSDLEVEHEEIRGHLYYIHYPLQTEDGVITVATTRPETLLGDTAVAVNPDDKRFQGLIGRKALLPILGRVIPIISDDLVDPSFGTGAVKITPGHDPVDFEIAQRQGLPLVNIMNLDATMNQNAGPYAGLDRFACREALLADLDKEGLLQKTEPYVHAVGHCHRCRTVAEPLVSKQWFVKVAPLAERATEAVLDGGIEIIPERFTKVYLNWMENIRDWCISRQLWWGHRIPAWYCGDCDGDKIHVILAEPLTIDGVSSIAGPYSLFQEAGITEEGIEWVGIDLEATPIVSAEPPTSCPQCGSTHLIQDPDVLDTWFSSALWPHSTLGWPEQTEDLAYFYPTSVMETGYDILFFWVARMVMMGLENTGEVPFRKVYLHGLIRDEKGEKMSKTRGNVIDPLDVMSAYGTDALRFALTAGSAPGNDIRLTPQRLEGSRNFANKLWNTARFVIGNLDGEAKAPKYPLPAEDRWILSQLNRNIANVSRLLESFMLGEALSQLHDFIWGEYCDWYIELAKIRLSREGLSPIPVLVYVLETSLRLLHPFMPFITEELWQSLARYLPQSAESITIAPYPGVDERAFDPEAEEEMELVQELIRSIRNARVEAKVEPSRFIEAIIIADDKPAVEALALAIGILARARPLTILGADEERPRPDRAKILVLKRAEVFLPLAGMIDIEAERERLAREIEESRAEIARLERKLGQSEFLTKAPAHVIAREQEKLNKHGDKLSRLQQRLAELR
jgi:valyl-tRNA synthetase